MEAVCLNASRPTERTRKIQGEVELSIASYHLAKIRLLTRLGGRANPTRLEIGAAALELAEALGWQGPLPSSQTMASCCEREGLEICR